MPPWMRKLRRFGRFLPAGKTRLHRKAGDEARRRLDWKAAGDAYERHLAIRPDDAAIWVQLGHARKEHGLRDEAAAAYGRALSLTPDDADLLLSLGHLHKANGETDLAARHYWRSFRIDGNAAAASELAEPGVGALLAADLMGGSDEASVLSPRSIVPQGAVEMTDGSTITGWAADPGGGAADPMVVFFQDGRLVGECTPTLFRADNLLAGRAGPINGFDIALDLDFRRSDEVEIVARFGRTGQPLAGSPIAARAPRGLGGWLRRSAGVGGDELTRLKAAANRGLAGRLSIVMPVHDPRPAWLREALLSVRAQWCDAWELICVDDGSTDQRVVDLLAEAASADSRVRTIRLDRNLGIAAATNHGILAATGDYIAFLDHDDALEPEAVGCMLQAASARADLLYSDEVVTGENIDALRHVMARPAFSYDYYLSHPYFVHFIAVRAGLARETLWNDRMSISADVDFVLRVLERAERVTHVPTILYRWRTHGDSAGHARKGEVTEATLAALDRHFRRTGRRATASAGPSFNCYRIDFEDDARPTAIIIPTKNRHDLLRVVIESIWRTTTPGDAELIVIDHQSDEPATRRYLASIADRVKVLTYAGPFNFARMNNVAVAALNDRHRFIVFMNNDIEARAPGWLEHLRGLCARPEVGAVGATLLYPSGLIQHAGVVMGLNGLIDHAHKFRPLWLVNGERNPGYNSSLSSTRDYSAVTAACMMVRRDVFDEVGGFDESFEVGFNDADLCLRIGQAGYAVLNDAHAVLYHHESATRASTPTMLHPDDARRLIDRWGSMMGGADPFYSPLLSLAPPADHIIAELDRGWATPRTRLVRGPSGRRA